MSALNESGAIYKDPGAARLSVCLVYPNTYHVGMSSLGFQGVYGLFNGRDDVVCERAFMPDEQELAELRRTRKSITSIESGRALAEFHVIAFSASFENDYPNILRILELARLPLRATERAARMPIVIMGGVCAMSNPEPLAQFMDAVAVGEAEVLIDSIVEACLGATDKAQAIEAMSRVEGMYIPSMYEIQYNASGRISSRIARAGAPERITLVKLRDLDSSQVRHAIVSPDTEFAGMCLVEAQRGCPWSCRFCLAGHVFNPPRKKSLERITSEIQSAMQRATRIGLIGPSLSDYPHYEQVLGIEGVDFSITSLRASPKSAALVKRIKEKRSVSIAPEAGTERLRRIIDKRITDEDIMSTANALFEAGIERLRLYFMLGLPGECDDDARGIVELVGRVRALSKKGIISLTLSTFVPKPCTPFQWSAMAPKDIIKRRLDIVKKGLKSASGVNVSHDVLKYSYMQGLFAVGDRRVGAVLEGMLDTDDWQGAARRAGLNPDEYAMRERAFDEPLPWDFIDAGLDKHALWSSRN